MLRTSVFHLFYLSTSCLFLFFRRQTDEWENRRYNYVHFSNGSTNGHNVMCFKAEQTSLATLTLLDNHCSNCFCYCDEPGETSDRYFSLHAQTSNITANKYDRYIIYSAICASRSHSVAVSLSCDFSLFSALVCECF